jgi:uncharacterized protein (UPF0276 family)
MNLTESASLAPGIGLRTPHLQAIERRRPTLGFLEVHPENYFCHPIALARLEALRNHYPLSLHAVGLSLGSAGELDANHLGKLADLVKRLKPAFVSDHLSWSSIDGVHLNDLLPLPYTDEALAVVISHVEQIQDRLGQPLLIENPSNYLAWRHSTMSEAEFLAELVRRTDCGLLLDLNNIYVSAHNLEADIEDWFALLPSHAIQEIHLAGHARIPSVASSLLIDDHGSKVPPAVWSLYQKALDQYGYRPTLIEWDTNLPDLDVLCDQAALAQNLAAQVTTP